MGRHWLGASRKDSLGARALTSTGQQALAHSFSLYPESESLRKMKATPGILTERF